MYSRHYMRLSCQGLIEAAQLLRGIGNFDPILHRLQQRDILDLINLRQQHCAGRTVFQLQRYLDAGQQTLPQPALKPAKLAAQFTELFAAQFTKQFTKQYPFLRNRSHQ